MILNGHLAEEGGETLQAYPGGGQILLKQRDEDAFVDVEGQVRGDLKVGKDARQRREFFPPVVEHHGRVICVHPHKAFARLQGHTFEEAVQRNNEQKR